MDSESGVQSQCLPEPRSELKVLVGQKRAILEVEEMSETTEKRVKLRDLESVFRSESQAGRDGMSTIDPNENSNSRTLDLNAGSADGTVGDAAPACFEESNKPFTSLKEKMEHKNGFANSRGLDLDLNAEDPFYPYKNYEYLKTRDDSECGSSLGPLDGKDSMRVWKGLKRNNFMSAAHGTVPMAIPKPRGRKKNNTDTMKRKLELAEKEQVDRFARVAAPSGLLNGLNPGIINHVRNSKQVHSIIEALVKSERAEKQQSGKINRNNQIKAGTTLLGKRQMGDYPFFSKSIYSNNGFLKGNTDQYGKENGSFLGMSSKYDVENGNDRLALKLSTSVGAASEYTSCLSNEQSANFTSVYSLSVKAANVASHWLELLTQDIEGRLAALRRSKKRVEAVITTELPLLISKEFSSNVSQATVDAHSVKWSTLFGQMDKALLDEESHLESWLNQVKEMQLHCERGLHSSVPHGPQLIGSIGNDSRSGEVDNSENDLAVRAAAASIYSTCNFLLSMENPSCC